jgi:hypothetical protein
VLAGVLVFGVIDNAMNPHPDAPSVSTKGIASTLPAHSSTEPVG